MSIRPETVMNIELENLIPFREDPFQVREDEQMRMLEESIRSIGVLVTVIQSKKFWLWHIRFIMRGICPLSFLIPL